MTRIRLTLHAQSGDDTMTHVGSRLTRENTLQLAPRKPGQGDLHADALHLSDVGVAATLAAKTTGAKVSTSESRPARRKWILVFRWPDGMLRVTRHDMPVGNPVLEFAFDAPPLRIGAFARELHARAGDRIWHYQHGPALEKASGTPANHATELWLTLLGRKQSHPSARPRAHATGPSGPAGQKAREEHARKKEEPKREAPPPPPKPKPNGPPLDALAALGLEPDAQWDDVRSAYRKLAQALHPDKHQGDPFFNAQFRRVNQAYGELKEHYARKSEA